MSPVFDLLSKKCQFIAPIIKFNVHHTQPAHQQLLLHALLFKRSTLRVSQCTQFRVSRWIRKSLQLLLFSKITTEYRCGRFPSWRVNYSHTKIIKTWKHKLCSYRMTSKLSFFIRVSSLTAKAILFSHFSTWKNRLYENWWSKCFVCLSKNLYQHPEATTSLLNATS